MRTSLRSASLAMYVLVLACGDAPIPSATSGGTDSHTSEATGAGLDSSGSAAGSTSDPGAATSGDSTGADSSADGGGPPVVFDVFTPDVPVGGVFCVAGEVEVVEDCVDRAPPESFEPEVQWAWEGTDALRESFVTPLVANFTDDDDNGVIDLCDVPDVVVLGHAAGVIPSGNGRIAVLDGATGALHFQIDTPLSGHVNPAIGDIDGDGLVEIVAAINEDIMVGRLVAFEHDGSLKWTGDTLFTIAQHAIALADVDADGDVEIMLDAHLADHEGHQIWDHGSDQGIQITTAADLDDDGDLEIILGAQAYHHDGTEYWNLPEVPSWGHPHVADIDGDGRPEVVVAALDGVAVIEHDGVVTATAAVPGLSAWRPGAIHDIDGDGQPEILLGAANSYSALTVDFAELWTATVQDSSGYAAGTAFDFLGDGTAEAMYADETTMFVFGEGGAVLMTAPRASWTQAENPVVADVDNDGSAEIVVVSNRGYSNSMQPVVQVLRDAEDRWIPARRIWNQHAYHVTNVREDGTIPQQQVPHWTSLNTFRTQAQVSASGSVCVPAG